MVRLIFSLLIAISFNVSAGNPDTLTINANQLFNQHYLWSCNPNLAEFPLSSDGLYYTDTLRIYGETDIFVKTKKGCLYKMNNAIKDSSFIYKINNSTIRLKKKGYKAVNQKAKGRL